MTASMKYFASGRIIFWRGGSVWIGMMEKETDFHAHHAIQLTLALSGGAVYFQTPDQDWTSYRAAIIAANQPHAFKSCSELVALIFTEPESREGRVLRQRYRTGIGTLAPESFHVESQALAAAFLEGAGDEELAMRVRAVTAKLTDIQQLPPKPLDERIERAIGILRDRLGETVTMAEISDTVHLSSERFRHLFLQETGIRFRPYVLWLRLEVAVAAFAAGSSLTEAAYAGGFADSAHLSRTFKRMFGFPPVRVQPV